MPAKTLQRGGRLGPPPKFCADGSGPEDSEAANLVHGSFDRFITSDGPLVQ